MLAIAKRDGYTPYALIVSATASATTSNWSRAARRRRRRGVAGT